MSDFPRDNDNPWQAVADVRPPPGLVETRLEGEKGTNLCHTMPFEEGIEIEWVETRTGVTTVTHSTFAAPTHWRKATAAQKEWMQKNVGRYS